MRAKALEKPVRIDSRRRRRFKVTLGIHASFTVDVSSGGFSTESMRVLPAGTEVVGTIQIEGKELPFSGRIAWAKASAPQMGLRGMMGVRFINTPKELLALMKT